MSMSPDEQSEATEARLIVHPIGTRTIPEFNMVPALREVGSLLELARRGAGLGTCSSRTIIRSAVVLLAACWEAYVEDLLTQAFDFLVANAPSGKHLPKRLRQLVAKAIADNKNELKMWDLAGSGWKNKLEAHAAEIIARHVGRFNTPKAQNTQDVFHNVLGIVDVTQEWGELGEHTREEAREQLNEFITARGAIAHGDPDAEEISDKELLRFINLVMNLAIMTGNVVRKHVQEITGKDMAEKYAGQRVIFYKDVETGRAHTVVLEIEEDSSQEPDRDK